MHIKVLHKITGSVLFDGDTANLYGADLRGADLGGADLGGANLGGANLYGAKLYGADLRSADLRSADLGGADLGGADLRGADLRGANLYGADLRGADLRGADLRGANLYGANLYGANLYGANLRGADLPADFSDSVEFKRTRILPDEGSIIGWKKCRNDVLVKLRIPEAAKRSHAFGRKCRAEYAEVLEVIGAEEAFSSHDDGKTIYRAGETVRPDSFDPDWRNECAPGIHFFITRAEAEAY